MILEPKFGGNKLILDASAHGKTIRVPRGCWIHVHLWEGEGNRMWEIDPRPGLPILNMKNTDFLFLKRAKRIRIFRFKAERQFGGLAFISLRKKNEQGEMAQRFRIGIEIIE